MAPSDENECNKCCIQDFLLTDLRLFVIPEDLDQGEMKKHDCIPIGKAEVKRPGKRGAILSFGTRSTFFSSWRNMISCRQHAFCEAS